MSLFDHWHELSDALRDDQPGFPNQFHAGFIQGGVSANTTATMYEQQAQHIAYIIAEAQKRGATVVEASQEARTAGSIPSTNFAFDNSAFEMTCTPGYYNNEGRGARVDNGGFLGDFYSPRVSTPSTN